ncbi:MAG TPA: PfkB family carbohydrate kinase [Solirubrobacteraceae bacterium]
MSEAAVVVVGSVNADLVVSVRQLPRPGETVSGGTFARHGGGKGANQAVAAARLGARVAFVGAVGNDDLGEEALRELAGEGVDVSAAARVEGVATGVAVIVVDERGENQIAVASGANAALTGDAVAAALTPLVASPAGATEPSYGAEPAGVAAPPASSAGGGAAAGVVLLGHEVPEAAVVAGARAARAAGWTAILNPAPARPLPAGIAGVLLTPNADEARALTGEDDPEAAARALADHTGAPVLVTLGPDGALLLDDTAERLPAPAVDVVDTTGAGDTVNGALAAELAAGIPLRDAARFALAAAALSTRAAGARAGMPRRHEVR